MVNWFVISMVAGFVGSSFVQDTCTGTPACTPNFAATGSCSYQMSGSESGGTCGCDSQDPPACVKQSNCAVNKTIRLVVTSASGKWEDGSCVAQGGTAEETATLNSCNSAVGRTGALYSGANCSGSTTCTIVLSWNCPVSNCSTKTCPDN
jgi:hypothetical protein